jgi:cytochrome c biogenesis protein CcmG, thiol:disulfide interchange protein DsbE
MKSISLLFVFTLLLSGCTSTSKLDGNGVIPGCDQIRIGTVTNKKLELPCLDDSISIDFYQIKGPIVINVWGSWCEGCRQEMPYFIDLYATQSFKSGQIQLLGIDVEENSPASGPDYIKQSGMSWPHLNDVDDQTKAIFGPGVPVTWFINSQGVVVEKHIGAYQNKKQLFNQVEKAFGIIL